MAKEPGVKTDFPTWMKFVLMLLALGGIVYGWGATHSAGQARMENMEAAGIVLSKADVNFSVEIKEIKEDVHGIKIDQAKDIALKESLLKTMIRLEGKMDSFSAEQAIIKLDVNTTKVKVDTLTRD